MFLFAYSKQFTSLRSSIQSFILCSSELKLSCKQQIEQNLFSYSFKRFAL